MPSCDSTMQPIITPQSERARGVHHAHRLAHAAGLRELDVDPVGVAGHRRHVAQVVAALVDDHRRPRLQLAQRAEACPGRRPGTAARSAPRRARPAPAPARAPSRASSPRWRPRAAARRDSLAHRLQPREVLGAADLDLQRRGSPRARRARSRVPSSVSMPIVNEVGGARRRQPEQAPDRHARAAGRPSRAAPRRARRGPGLAVARAAASPIASSANGSSPSRAGRRVVAQERRRRTSSTRRGSRPARPRRGRPCRRAPARRCTTLCVVREPRAMPNSSASASEGCRGVAPRRRLTA